MSTLNAHELRAILDADEAQRRRERYERRTGRGRRAQKSKRQRDMNAQVWA